MQSNQPEGRLLETGAAAADFVIPHRRCVESSPAISLSLSTRQPAFTSIELLGSSRYWSPFGGSSSCCFTYFAAAATILPVAHKSMFSDVFVFGAIGFSQKADQLWRAVLAEGLTETTPAYIEANVISSVSSRFTHAVGEEDAVPGQACHRRSNR